MTENEERAYDEGQFDGATQERERIIKILEADLERAGLTQHNKAHSIAEVIALIKGENE